MPRDVLRRLERLEREARTAWWPPGDPGTWTDDQLWEVLERYDPDMRERIASMSDAEVLAELQRLTQPPRRPF